MNRLLLFLCCICASWMARGQAAYEWLYWFDMNHASRVSGQSIGDRFTITADADGLSEGIHTIHVQVADTAGKYSPPLGQLFYYTSGRAVKRLYYWFDNEVALTQTIPAPLNDLSIDVSGLEPGLHFIYCQVEDAAGIRSDVMCRAFYRRPVKSALKWTYWFDDDEDSCVTVPLPGEVTMIDVSHLQEGFHVLHSQVYDVTASDITTTMFIKVPQTEGVGDMTCICTVDGKLVAKESLPTAGGILKWNMDVDNMDVGIHKAMFQVITPSGAASSIAERYFVRAITNKEMGGMKCIYTIDNFQTQYQAGTLSDGLFHFDLDVASIENGLHRLAYTLVSETGVTLPQKTAFFWKTPLGGDGIVQYNYWLNERDDQKHVVQLDKRTNPFSLIALLPVETQPIRSSNFQFAIKNGKPLIYARNEFHIQFFDTNGRMVEETKQYVDEQVSAEVLDIEMLEHGITATTDKPEENTIKWYQVTALRGDSLNFKTDLACTLQLFTPSGEEIYTASGSEAVTWGGHSAPQDGTYYVALHDVTAKRANTVNIDFQHIGKYMVQSHTPRKIGVAPQSFIMQLEGNGFDKLQDVKLELGEHVIYTDTITVLNKAQAYLHYLLSGDEAIGQYNMVLSFYDIETDEHDTLRINNAVTFEEAEYGDIDIAIVSRSIVASPYPVHIKLKNTGNIGYTMVPLYVAYDKADIVSEMIYMNFDVEIDDRIAEAGLANGYYTDNLLGRGVIGRFYDFIIPQIGPGEEIELVVGFLAPAHYRYGLYVSTGMPWSLYTYDTAKNASFKKARRLVEGECYDGPCKAFQTQNINCPCGTILKNIQELDRLTRIPFISPNVRKAPHTLIKKSSLIAKLMENCEEIPLRDIIRDLSKLTKEEAEKYCPEQKPHTIEQWNPGDPNDILGYLSVAGSKFIADSVARVNYTIEFENDPEIANASAHTIVIKDTLDNKVFDLTKFMPTGIRIGSREAFLDAADVVTKNNVTSFVKTIDMRPEINAIAQVDGTFNQKNGIAQWTLQSLDPMTMEPTDDLMQGILPVNYNGTSGIGEVMFEVGVKQGKTDGTQIKNRAGIVFDYEEAILTPTWTNIVDAVAPSSVIDNSWMVNDSTLRITADGFDERSGVWKYEWYVQAGENAPWWKEGETESPQFDYHIFEGIDYGFCVLATDSAGNVEQKIIERERGFKTYGPDFEDKIDEAPASAPDKEGAIYDLSGRRQAVPKDNQINIIDKKKVLFRRKN